MLNVSTRIDQRWCAFAVAAAVLGMPLHPARADDPGARGAAADPTTAGEKSSADAEAVAAVEALDHKALEDYDNLNFDEARAALKEALALCDRNGLGSHPVRARTYLDLGVVLLAADAKHREVAVAHFRRALQIQADIQLAERIANPEVQQAFAEARGGIEAERIRAHPPAPAAPGPSRAAPDGREADLSAAEEDEEPEEAHPARWLIGFGLGSGFGWASGTGEVSASTVPSGFQPSSMVHLAPEVGYFVRPDLLLSLQGRIQLISGATPQRDPGGTACGPDQVCSASHGASAWFAKATWLLAPSGFRPFLSGALGYGQIRHVVSLTGRNDCGADAAHPVACVDTTKAGPVFIGPGAGFLLNLGPHFALTVGASTLLGMSAFTFQVDVSGGVVIQL